MPNAPATTGPHVETEPGGDTVTGRFVDLAGRRFYRIGVYDLLDPFFMTLASSSDVWTFISSSGGVTAGRVDADRALFPYTTEDKVTETAGTSGGLTLLRVQSEGGPPEIWEPFTGGHHDTRAVRALYKDALGSTLVFEETRPDLGLRARVTWETSDRFGVVRTCELAALPGRTATLEVVDGLVNLLPAGVDAKTQNELSILLDAYKRSELDDSTGVGLAYLSSTLTDLAEPSESLRATVAWRVGLDTATPLLSTRQLAGFRRGGSLEAERDVRGARCAYLLHTRLTLADGDRRSWRVVADVRYDAADVVALSELLGDSRAAAAALDRDVAESRSTLEGIVAAADGVQLSGEEIASTHHTANVLFNVMRGGIPADGYRVDPEDVRTFLAQRSPAVSRRCADFLASLPGDLTSTQLVEMARQHDDVDLFRLCREYIPLTFSRRHGDPSRPWNKFRIAVRNEDGSKRLDHQGNWRDIFQNWESLAWSHPEYVESMVAVFLDATTADGYNPYRITREGIDWEVPEPGNPWANIGYWSDHQIVYLLKLLETSKRFHPGRLSSLADRAVFTFADVPYRIASYEQTLRDPYETITYDLERAALVESRSAEGGDARLLHGPDGDLVRVTFAEKLLGLLLAKLVNLVPDGGIWMNTQRPEWNDANNALVGRGLSVVTLAYLRRYLAFLGEVLVDDAVLTQELAELVRRVSRLLTEHAPAVEDMDDACRREVMDRLGEAGTAYRARVYEGFGTARETVPAAEVTALLDVATRYVDAGLRSNRRDDGLFHSYNLLELDGARAGVGRLPEMLEGQVAVLSSGLLSPGEALSLLSALRSSRLYRADQHSYLLYPDKDIPGFLSRNRVTPEHESAAPLLAELADSGDVSVVRRDERGVLRFAGGLRNRRDVEAALDRAAVASGLAEEVRRGRDGVLAVFEEVFRHAEYTGRSGSFFAFEGLGSIYWHMISKLLLAVQETLERGAAEGAPAEQLEALAAVYEDVRAGLGYRKQPEVYGAFPADPYSHTPAGSGARQPGMTGQVKEEVLTRLGELGLRVEDGRIVVRPLLLRATEWTPEDLCFDYRDVDGAPRSLEVPTGSLAFTFCGVPVLYRRSDRLDAVAHLADGGKLEMPGGVLDEETSAAIFRRDGSVRLLEVHCPDGLL